MMKYAIKIYDSDMNELARLENSYEISYELVLNELWTCKFKLPKDDKKNRYCQPYNLVELYDGKERIELFRILPSVFTRSELAYIEYECEHVLATLLDDVMFKYHQIGNLGIYTDKVIRYVLDRQTVKRWQLIECDFKNQFEYKWENENLLSALFSIANPLKEAYRWEFDTTSKPWGISLKKTSDNYKADIQYKKNMQNIEKTSDPTNLVTRLYALGYGEGDNQLTIKNVNNGKPYLEKNISKYGLKSSILVDRRFENPTTLKEYAQKTLDEMSEPYITYKLKAVDLHINNPGKYPKFKVGDKVLIRDTEDNINLTAPIIKISKSDVRGNPFDIDLEIANKSRSVVGSISALQERTRINDTYAQGATNLQQIAYADNADEKHPLKIKFYIPQEMARINKLILNYSIEPFRSYSVGLEYSGGVSKTTSSGGGQYTSTTTSSGGGQYTSTGGAGGGTRFGTTGAENWTANGRGHNHGIPHGTPIYDGRGNPVAWFAESGDHTHSFEIDMGQHRHVVDIKSHSHSVNINVREHTHDFNIPSHTHKTRHGIFEGDRANVCYLKVDGRKTNTTAKEVNIIPFLSKDSAGKINRGVWHEVEITPDKLTRINANIFIQLFTNSRGEGDF